MWTLKTLIESTNQNHVCINEKWVPARPINYRYRSLRERMRAAWAVFVGRADSFTWPEGQ